MAHLVTDNKAIRLYDDVVGFAVFTLNDFFLLTKWVELHG